MERQNIYLGHDNDLRIQLLNNGQPQDLSNATKISATFGSDTVENTNPTAAPIMWQGSGFYTGEVRLHMEDEVLTGGDYETPIVVYDSQHPDGIVWGSIPTTVVEEFENPP